MTASGKSVAAATRARRLRTMRKAHPQLMWPHPKLRAAICAGVQLPGAAGPGAGPGAGLGAGGAGGEGVGGSGLHAALVLKLHSCKHAALGSSRTVNWSPGGPLGPSEARSHWNAISTPRLVPSGHASPFES